LILALLVPVMLAGTMSMNEIVEVQSIWFIAMVPVPALVFFISNLAEIGRAPFDLLEAESEIVAGYHIEYSGMKFGLFMAAEFIHTFTVAGLMAAIFFGGWRGPFAAQVPTLGPIYFMGKTTVIWLGIVLIRTTLPRLRIDQLMNFNWKFLVPVSLGALMVIPLVDKIAMTAGLYVPLDVEMVRAMGLAESIQANLLRAGVLLATNVLYAALVLSVVARWGRQQREAAQTEPVAAETAAAAAGD
jgi:NADH-quinone oxidoreductase subunit H